MMGKLRAAERARVHARSHRRAHVGVRGVDAIACSRGVLFSSRAPKVKKKAVIASILLTVLARRGLAARDSRAAIRRAVDGRRGGELS
jgi:hypothetical protein